MKNLRSAVLGTVFLIISASAVWSQQNANSAGDQPAGSTSQLPRLVRFSGTLKDVDGTPLTGIAGVTFALYSEQAGGAPLWLETQNITADSNGHYTVLLGSTKPDGLPTELFTTEQARWVGVQVSGQAEQPRVLLVSAPVCIEGRRCGNRRRIAGFGVCASGACGGGKWQRRSERDGQRGSKFGGCGTGADFVRRDHDRRNGEYDSAVHHGHQHSELDSDADEHHGDQCTRQAESAGHRDSDFVQGVPLTACGS